MKIRNGFVSNSSSSSFIIVFPQAIASADEMGQILFGEKYEQDEGISYYGEAYPMSMIAKTVYNDYLEAGKESDSAKLNHLNNNEMSVTEKKYLQRLLTIESNNTIIRLEYGDKSGSYYSVLEHGGIFDNVPHIRISNH